MSSAIIPTDVLVTGFDIIFFWVARMMMMGLHFMGTFRSRRSTSTALVRDEKGAKMSKSKGNVIDPLHLINDLRRPTRCASRLPRWQPRAATSSSRRNASEGYRNFADQAVECLPLRRDERLRAAFGFRSDESEGNAEPLIAARDGARHAAK